MGKFEKGKPGNPGGRKKAPSVEVKELIRESIPTAIMTLRKIMENEQARSTSRVAAARELLNRGLGMPTQHITAEVASTVINMIWPPPTEAYIEPEHKQITKSVEILPPATKWPM